jgi:hypothetical protein
MMPFWSHHIIKTNLEKLVGISRGYIIIFSINYNWPNSAFQNSWQNYFIQKGHKKSIFKKVLLIVKKYLKIQLYCGAHLGLRAKLIFSHFCQLLLLTPDTCEWKSLTASNVCSHIPFKTVKKLRNSNWNALVITLVLSAVVLANAELLMLHLSRNLSIFSRNLLMT